MAILEEDLSKALEKGQGYIAYLRKGNLPSSDTDLEKLVRLLVKKGGIDTPEGVKKFLKLGLKDDYRDYPALAQLPQQLFASLNSKGRGIVTALAKPFTAADMHFIAGPAIQEPHQFFGRTADLRHLCGRLAKNPLEHSAIIGPKRSGKTSLLHYLQRITTTPPSHLRPHQKADWFVHAKWKPAQYNWVLVDFHDIRMTRLATLLRYLQKELQLSPLEDESLEAFMETAVEHAWTRPTILLIDELDEGLSAPELTQAFWHCLRSLALNYSHGNLGFIITAREDPRLVASRLGKTSPFFNIFQHSDLKPLLDEEARELINSTPHTFDTPTQEWLMAQSHGWPAALQLLCKTYAIEQLNGHSLEVSRQAALKSLQPVKHLLGSSP